MRRSSTILREIAASQLRGCGIEFGAGYNPYPVPLHCTVRYADRWSIEDYKAQFHPGAAFVDAVVADLCSDLQELAGIADDSQDFIIGAHVIEHTRSPLHAFHNAYRKLRRGGRFLLVVPDKRYTFDRTRELTPLEHIVLDYNSPLPERDWPHYFEFCIKALGTPVESLYETATSAFRSKGDLHFHTWTYESFMEMVNYAVCEISPWREIWSQPAIRDGEEDIEFYVVLAK